MARIDLFNAKSSENVLSELPSKNGMDFNFAPGAGPEAIPSSLGTSQGNSNPNYSSNKNKQTTAQALNPHGTLVRNITSDNYTSNSPAINAVTGAIKNGLTAPIFVPSTTEQAWIGNNVFGKPIYGAPEVQITNYSGTRDSLSLPSNGNNIKKTTLIPNVGSRFYRA